MHEYYITEQIVSIVMQEAEKQEAKKITKVKVVAGELRAIIEDSLKLYFELLTADTIAAGAQLDITIAKAVLYCEQCNLNFEKNYYLACPHCGKKGILTDSGRELYVETIEVTC